jgi:hypothetical protein
MRRSKNSTKHHVPAVLASRWGRRSLSVAVLTVFGLLFAQFGPGLIGLATASQPLQVYVGYMDTHSKAFSSSQPNPWPYKDSSSFIGSPCPNYPNATNCWDAATVRLVNPTGSKVTKVKVEVIITSHTYSLWGSSDTVQAHGQLVLTETGKQNSENFDLSDFAPNAYNGGNKASCKNDGAIPEVKLTVGGTTTTYKDKGQILNTRGADGGHCVNGKFVSTRVDESHPWVKIGG